MPATVLSMKADGPFERWIEFVAVLGVGLVACVVVGVLSVVLVASTGACPDGADGVPELEAEDEVSVAEDECVVLTLVGDNTDSLLCSVLVGLFALAAVDEFDEVHL